MPRWFTLAAAFLLLASAAHAQRALSGTVTDAATGETLPGATVSVLGPDGAVVGGTATGLDGRFAVRLTQIPADVAVRFLGYETARLRVTAQTPGEVAVALAPSEAALGEVTVTAGEDPAVALLRRVIARVRAQRAAVGPYAVTAYQRTTVFAPGGRVQGITEGSSEAFWIPGTGWRETVVASRRTANLGAGRATPGGVAAGLQDLLAEDLDVAGHRLMGPTHRDALGAYRAAITGTSVLDGRLVVELTVRPARATASAFEGTLQVLFDTADVLAADLRPGASFLFPPPVEVTGARFRQQYVPVAADSSLWLPADLRSELAIGFRVEGLLSADPFRVEETIQLSGYRLGAVAPDSLAAGPAVRRAARPDSLALDAPGARPPLTAAEADAYAAGDSLGAIGEILVFRGPLARLARRSVRINVGGAADSTEAVPTFDVGFAPAFEINPAEGVRIGAAIPLRAGPLRVRPLAAFRTADRGVTLGVDAELTLVRRGDARLSLVGGALDGVVRRVVPSAPPTLFLGGRGGYYASRQVSGGARLNLDDLGTLRQGGFLSLDTEAAVDLRYVVETASGFDTPAPDRLGFGPPGASATTQSLRLGAAVGTLDEPLGLLPSRALRLTAEAGARGGLGYTRADATLDGRIVTFGRRRVLPAALDVRVAGGVSGGSLPPFRQFALEGVATGVSGGRGGLTAFGALRGQTDVPPAGDRYALVAYEHSFRTLPFEVLGLQSLVRRQYNVLVHGAHARTWGGPLAHTRWHHEVGVSISGLVGGLRLDLTQRLDRRQAVFGVGVARVF